MTRVMFVPTMLPRTWTKMQWKAAYRWVRITRKEVRKLEEEMINNVLIYGTTNPELLDRITNPPVILGPGMEEAMRERR